MTGRWLVDIERQILWWTRQLALGVSTVSCRGIRLCVASFCKIAILLLLFEPCAEELSKPVGAEHFSRRLSHEESAPEQSHYRKSVPPVSIFQRFAAATVAHTSRLFGQALARTSAHVLSNGVRAPMLA